MMRKNNEPISYTNRKGKTYNPHAAVRKSGKTVYVMKLSADGALTELPEGYSIAEGINGEVSVGRQKPRQITEQEEAQVAAALERLGLKHYRCAAKDAYLVIYEPLRSEADFRETARLLAGPFAGQFDSWISDKLATEPLQPVMRFQFADKERRLFTVERMTYSGEGGWHWLTVARSKLRFRSMWA